MICVPSRYAALVAILCAVSIRAETDLDETRSTLEKWVETRQLVSRTRADWQADKDLLQETIALYERELAGLDEQMSRISTNNTQVAREMAEAEALKQASQAALDRARDFATGFEAEIRKCAGQLPAPLQETLAPHLARMPADPATTKMLPADRVQVAVGLLNEIDKFNNAVNVFSEKRSNDRGEEVSVQTLYVGLGAAYFVNDTADFAGTGKPGPNGWEWTANNALAPAVQDAVHIYRNERTARFVPLPVALQ
jgi:septal ring factor EnvC (AmiA/AmiB activator)